MIYHTLGWANEYEQGSGNSLAEPWEYFPFNDRDFTSVAELMLVPGCSPGLFTKQFVEFSPAAGNVDQHLQCGDPGVDSADGRAGCDDRGDGSQTQQTTTARGTTRTTSTDGNERVDSSVQHRLAAVCLCVRYATRRAHRGLRRLLSRELTLT